MNKYWTKEGFSVIHLACYLIKYKEISLFSPHYLILTNTLERIVAKGLHQIIARYQTTEASLP